MNEIQTQLPQQVKHYDLSNGQVAGVLLVCFLVMMVALGLALAPFCTRGTPEPRPTHWEVAEGTSQAPV